MHRRNTQKIQIMKKELIIKATLFDYVATHALTITEQTLTQCADLKQFAKIT